MNTSTNELSVRKGTTGSTEPKYSGQTTRVVHKINDALPQRERIWFWIIYVQFGQTVTHSPLARHPKVWPILFQESLVPVPSVPSALELVELPMASPQTGAASSSSSSSAWSCTGSMASAAPSVTSTEGGGSCSSTSWISTVDSAGGGETLMDQAGSIAKQLSQRWFVIQRRSACMASIYQASQAPVVMQTSHVHERLEFARLQPACFARWMSSHPWLQRAICQRLEQLQHSMVPRFARFSPLENLSILSLFTITATSTTTITITTTATTTTNHGGYYYYYYYCLGSGYGYSDTRSYYCYLSTWQKQTSIVTFGAIWCWRNWQCDQQTRVQIFNPLSAQSRERPHKSPRSVQTYGS